MFNFNSYAQSREHDVKRGAETPELAALLVQKYGYGISQALRLASELADESPMDILAEVDQRVSKIDPDWLVNQKRRFESRPAAIAFRT